MHQSLYARQVSPLTRSHVLLAAKYVSAHVVQGCDLRLLGDKGGHHCLVGLSVRHKPAGECLRLTALPVPLLHGCLSADMLGHLAFLMYVQEGLAEQMTLKLCLRSINSASPCCRYMRNCWTLKMLQDVLAEQPVSATRGLHKTAHSLHEAQ